MRGATLLDRLRAVDRLFAWAPLYIQESIDMAKNKAAVALGKKRWAGTTPAERSERMRAVAQGRMASMTAEKRAEVAGAGGRATAGKKRRPGGGRKKKAATQPPTE